MKNIKELSVARNAVRQALTVCRHVREAYCDESAIQKFDRSPVTIADYAVQAAIIREITTAFPDIPVVGEEDSGHLKDPASAEVRHKVTRSVAVVYPGMSDTEVCGFLDRGNFAGGSAGKFWTLDPIDGTKGFIRGDQYAVALALIEEGEVVLGVLGCPNLPVSDDPGAGKGKRGCLFYASRGEGSFAEPEADPGAPVAIRIDAGRDIRQARLCESVESGHSAHDQSAQIVEILGITATPYRIDSQCKYAAVARGGASIYLRLPTRTDYREKIWDHAAGCILVEEAGGRVSDIHGKDLDFSRGRTLEENRGVIVTNGTFHDQTLGAVQQVLNLG